MLGTFLVIQLVVLAIFLFRPALHIPGCCGEPEPDVPASLNVPARFQAQVKCADGCRQVSGVESLVLTLPLNLPSDLDPSPGLVGLGWVEQSSSPETKAFTRPISSRNVPFPEFLSVQTWEYELPGDLFPHRTRKLADVPALYFEISPPLPTSRKGDWREEYLKRVAAERQRAEQAYEKRWEKYESLTLQNPENARDQGIALQMSLTSDSELVLTFDQLAFAYTTPPSDALSVSGGQQRTSPGLRPAVSLATTSAGV
jgi:hypothetical protein